MLALLLVLLSLCATPLASAAGAPFTATDAVTFAVARVTSTSRCDTGPRTAPLPERAKRAIWEGRTEIGAERRDRAGGGPGLGRGRAVSVVMITHRAREGTIRDALAEIQAESFQLAPVRLLRIEEQ